MKPYSEIVIVHYKTFEKHWCIRLPNVIVVLVVSQLNVPTLTRHCQKFRWHQFVVVLGNISFFKIIPLNSRFTYRFYFEMSVLWYVVSIISEEVYLFVLKRSDCSTKAVTKIQMHEQGNPGLVPMEWNPTWNPPNPNMNLIKFFR